jgi:hypothetical protein
VMSMRNMGLESESYSSGSHARDLGSKRGNHNGGMEATSRTGTMKTHTTSNEGLFGKAIGVPIPMEIMEQDYEKPDTHAQVGIYSADAACAAAKRALSNKSQKANFRKGGHVDCGY